VTSSLYQLWRFENVLDAVQLANGYDRLYVPKVGYVTDDHSYVSHRGWVR
jgi:hypothetical protein